MIIFLVFGESTTINLTELIKLLFHVYDNY